MTLGHPPDDARWAHERASSRPSDPGAWERDCLEYTRWLLLKNNELPPEHQRHETRGVRLEGEYPDTHIVIEWWDRMYSREHVDKWALWADSLRAADGGREMPNQVALLVTTWLSERQPTRLED